MRAAEHTGWILHSRPYRETSLLVEVFTRERGRIGLVARGVRSARPRIARGLLQPFQPLLLSWTGSGELGTLTTLDAAAAPIPLVGPALLSGLYVNELLMRLMQRQDPHPEVADDYELCLQRLSTADPPAWTLRRFERDLLARLGYALLLDLEADGSTAVEAAGDYIYDPEHGPRRGTARAGSAPIALSGASLLALAQDRMPGEESLRELKRLMRAVLAVHLSGGKLNAWTKLHR